MNDPTQYNGSLTSVGKSICIVTGLSCLLVFFIDIAVIGLPPNLFSLNWRVEFCQQLGDRSLIFLFGMALTLYGIFTDRELTKKLSRVCLILGVIYMMSSIVVIRDAVVLKEQTFRNLDNQRRDIQESIEETRASGDLPPEISASEVQQASKSIADTAENIRRNAGRDIVKIGVSSVGNLIAVGVGLIGLSRIGIRRSLKYY